MEIKIRVWFEKNGEYLIGDGRMELLACVAKKGSLRAAAEAFGMSYPAAHSAIKRMEKRLGVALMKRRIGGRGGGGSQLTKRAEEILRCYESFKARVQTAVQRIAKKELFFFLVNRRRKG